MKEPKIRFQGFTGEWEKKNVQDVCNIISPTYKLQSCDYLKSGKYPIVDQSQSLVCGWSNSDRGLISDVPVIIFGDHTCILKYIDFPCIQGADGVKILLPKKDYIPTFVYQSFLSNPVIQDSYKRHFSDLKEKTFSFPPTLAGPVQNLAEQQKVASYFQNLDSLIQSTTKKIESLKQVKAASLQSMFPQEGETTPRVRFKGFTGEWEKSTFGELLIFERPDNYIVSNDVYSDEFSTPVLTANKGFILGYTNERRTFNSPCIIFDDFTLDSKFVDFPFMVKSSALKILTLRNEKKDSLYFVYTLLKQTKIEVLGHARHYISVVQPTQVYMPKDSTEQKMIASFFSNLDSQIALLSQQLEKLQQIKSACLDNMFV